MKTSMKSLLMLASILFIIFGFFAALEMLVFLDSILSSRSAWAIMVGFYVLFMCLSETIIGIIGLAKCGKPSKAKFFIVSGVVIFILCAINIVRNTFAGGFQISNLIGLLLPILFIIGGITRNRSGRATVAADSRKPKLRRALSIVSVAAVALIAATVAGLPFVNHSLTILSLKKIDDYPLYSMTYYGDYNLNYEAENPKAPHDDTPHCTCFLAFNEEGEPIYARNFDDALQSHPMAMLTTLASGKYATIAMCDLFYMGYNPGHLPAGSILTDQALLYSPRVPTDGMNEYGVAISYLGVPYREGDNPADPNKKSVDQTAMIRMVLDSAKNVDDAVNLVKSYNVVLEGSHVPAPGEPRDHDGLDSTHYLLADARGDSVIVEFIKGEVVVVRKSAPWQAVTNFIVSGQSHDGVGQDRYGLVEDELKARNGVLSEAEAMALLEKASQPGTHWSAVYNLKTGEVWLAMARNYGSVLRFRLQMHG